jgi:sodium-coupled monocarboxylate transporter 8/12
MKAVIWTDSVQFVVLCGGIVLILAFAVCAVPGGFPRIWQLAAEDGKTRILNLNWNPTVRLTVWGALLGGTCNNLVQMVTDQIAVQRYLTARSLQDAQRALWFKLWVTLPLVGLFYVTGTVLYGYYRAWPEQAPPLEQQQRVPALAQTQDASGEHRIKNDRILPYFVVHQLPAPLPGLLIAAIFGATMAVVSAGINALATAALMDFRRGAVTMAGSERRGLVLAKVSTVAFGILATLLALFVMPRLGTLLEATNTIMGLFGGPLLGIFFLGALARRANGSGALIGALVGALVGILVKFSEQLFDYPISFMWIPFSAATVTFVTGWLASMCFAAPGPAEQALVFRKRESKMPTAVG